MQRKSISTTPRLNSKSPFTILTALSLACHTPDFNFTALLRKHDLQIYPLTTNLCKISALCHDPMERKSISTAPHLHTIFCKAFFRHHGDKSSVALYVTLFLSAFKVDGLLFKGGSFMCRKGCHDWICQVENTWTRWVLQFERSHFETGGFFKCVIEKVLLEPKIELIQAMEEDLKNGLYPFFVSTTLGTTGCVAFDNLEEIGI